MGWKESMDSEGNNIKRKSGIKRMEVLIRLRCKHNGEKESYK